MAKNVMKYLYLRVKEKPIFYPVYFMALRRSTIYYK